MTTTLDATTNARKPDLVDDYAEYLALPVGATVQRPCKFRGEPRYVPEFWDAASPDAYNALEGDLFEASVDDGAVVRYPELEHVARIYLWADDNGFVYSSTT